MKVAGRWRYVYRAIDQHGQIIDVYVSPRRDTKAARRFFETALGTHGDPTEVVTDRAPALRAVIDELIPTAFHNTEQYANNRIEADHGRLKARLRPMRGLKRDHTARVIVRGHALMQNIRRGHYELGIEARPHRRVAHAFTQLARTIRTDLDRSLSRAAQSNPQRYRCVERTRMSIASAERRLMLEAARRSS